MLMPDTSGARLRRAFGAILLLAGALDARAACAPVEFTGGTNFYAGPQPYTMTLANVNGDAWIDVVVAGSDYNYLPIGGLFVFLGEPDARFRAHAYLAPEENVSDVVAGDFDGDGDDDLAYEGVFGSGSGVLHLLHNENGAFRERAQYTFERWSWGLSSGDFNGDGREDLAFISDDGQGHLLLGSATWQPELRSFAVSGDPTFPSVADLNRDGLDDLVAGSYDEWDDGAFSIFAGDREHGLRAVRTIETSRGVRTIAIGDFDGSGDTDVLAMGESITVTLLPGAGNPAAAPRELLLWSGGWNLPVVADFDRDGRDDVAFSASDGLQILGTVRDGAPPGETYFVMGRGPFIFGPEDIAAADFDRDGDVDVAAVTADGLTVLRNDGSGTLLTPRFAVYGHATGDFNNDGRDDVIDDDGVHLAAPDGSIPRGPWDPYTHSTDTIFVKTADVNHDGNLDAIFFLDDAPNSNAGRVRVLLGLGDGTLRPGQEFEMGEDFQDAAVADLNNDGHLDVTTVNSVADNDRAASTAYGNGDGTFAHSFNLRDHSFLYRIETGDFNGDGLTDVASMIANEPKPLRVAFGLGPGTFTEPKGIGPGFQHYIAADVNHDGLTDIIGASEWPTAKVYVLLGRADGTFLEKPEVHGIITGLNQMHTGDFNRDGHLDVLLTEGGTSAAEGWMAVLAGDGRGNFGPALPIRSQAYGIAHTGDFNGDGKLDVLDGGFPRLNTCVDGGPRRRATR